MSALLALLGTAWAVSPPEAPPADTAIVCVARNYDLTAASRLWTLRADDKVVADIRNKSFLCIDAEPGEYALSIRGEFAQHSTDYQPGAFGWGGGMVDGYDLEQQEDWMKIELAGGTVTLLRCHFTAGALVWEVIDEGWLMGRKLRKAKARHIYLSEWPGRRLAPK